MEKKLYEYWIYYHYHASPHKWIIFHFRIAWFNKWFIVKRSLSSLVPWFHRIPIHWVSFSEMTYTIWQCTKYLKGRERGKDIVRGGGLSSYHSCRGGEGTVNTQNWRKKGKYEKNFKTDKNSFKIKSL